MKEVILTGIRANDVLTLGNYIGGLLPIVELQHKFAGKYSVRMFVPDLHSFTTPINHDELYQNSIRNLKYFVAGGLDITNADTHVYRQSYIPAHTELAWILDCFTYFGEASRMVEFKDKAERIGHSSVTVGLFNYPVLMAADILLYGARWIPLGDDQRQHIELTRDLAMRLNNKFESQFPDGLFVVPEEPQKQAEFRGLETGVRIRSLRNPEKKMSKSVSDPAGTILLTDSPAEAAKKVMAATTDSMGSVKFDWQNQPGITNLLQILALLSGASQDQVNTDWEGKERYGDLKQAVALEVEAFLTKFQKDYEAVNEQELLEKLETDEIEMNKIANATLLRVQQAVGLRPRL